MGRDESLSLSCECKEDAIAYTVDISVLFSILITLKIIKVSEKNRCS